MNFEPYLGEQHDFTENKRKIYGVTDNFLLMDTFIFTNNVGVVVPMEFEYPYYYGTDFTTNGQYILPGPIPIEVFEVIWKVKGLGDGSLTLTPGGTTYQALLMRHDITMELADTVIADALIYEWLHNDGTPLAYIVSANAPLLGWGNNFDPVTGIIYGESLYHILQGY